MPQQLARVAEKKMKDCLRTCAAFISISLFITYVMTREIENMLTFRFFLIRIDICKKINLFLMPLH